MQKLIKKLIYAGVLEARTGLHIGAEKNTVEIGGIDNPVVRSALKERQPYIPGSTLKGKLRSLLQIAYGEADERQTGSLICKLFGAADSKDKSLLGNSSRLIVRDAYLTSNSLDELKNANEAGYTDMPFTELKTENHINRISGVANPRSQERIPAGVTFGIEMIINIYEGDDEDALKKTLIEGLKLLNNDYLGGSGTRGYGQVKITMSEPKVIDMKQIV